MCCVRNRNASKWRKVEVRVGGQGLIEGVLTMLDEHIQVVVGDCCVCLQVIQCLKLLDAEAADVAVVD